MVKKSIALILPALALGYEVSAFAGRSILLTIAPSHKGSYYGQNLWLDCVLKNISNIEQNIVLSPSANPQTNGTLGVSYSPTAGPVTNARLLAGQIYNYVISANVARTGAVIMTYMAEELKISVAEDSGAITCSCSLQIAGTSVSSTIPCNGWKPF